MFISGCVLQEDIFQPPLHQENYLTDECQPYLRLILTDIAISLIHHDLSKPMLSRPIYKLDTKYSRYTNSYNTPLKDIAPLVMS